jgi:GNAT superfamily N-acetyltransferase
MKPNEKKKELKIRTAKTGDAARLAELTSQLGYPSTPVEIRKRLSRIRPAAQHGILVAETKDAGVIGWIHVGKQPLLEAEIVAQINGLVVADAHRSLGVGAQLLSAAEEWARRHGCKGMVVRSNVIRERAHQFYERNGFEHYKTQKTFRKPL